MRTVSTLTLLVVLAVASIAAAAPEPTTEEQKTFYSLGLALSQGISGFNLSAAELELVKDGLTDGVLRKTPKADLQTYGPKLQDLPRPRRARPRRRPDSSSPRSSPERARRRKRLTR
jgi:FKBP-type peptidyl-prolyl cis-trans isomerase FkpA